MKIEKIILDNIRSYEHEEVEFPEGSILLSGDIGSGKTSILLAIEFAFFGLQPGQRGSFLLRNGTNEGKVTMEFELDGKKVIIERTLKRGKTISQNYCSITIDGAKEEISVMELKSRVLKLLKYPKEFSKKQNILYKFTVYTPQEEMKQIILEDASVRLNTLRHVFGIDKYKTILENSSIVLSSIREQRRIKEALISDLDREKESLEFKQEELEAKQNNQASIEKELFLKKEQRKKIEEETREVGSKIEEKKKLESEAEKTKIMISNKNDSIYDNIKTIERIKAQIKDLENLRFDKSQILKLEEKIDELKKEKADIEEKKIDIKSEINSLSLKNSDNESIIEKLKEIEICPTCLQNVDPVYKTNVFNKAEKNIAENSKRISDLNLEKKKLLEELSKLEEDISLKQKKISELQAIQIKLQNIEEKKVRIEEIQKSNSALEKDIGILNNHLRSLRDSISDLSKYEKTFESKKKELEGAFAEEKDAEIKQAELKKEIEVFSRQIEEIKERIDRFEGIKKELGYLVRLEDWISKRFMPVISFIEKNVMMKLQTEFSKLFSEWFSMLVPESFAVSLSDDFTPIIEYSDYEIAYSYLSGGERTAIALAYRLSLNQVLNSLMSKLKTRGMVILDEPTDGFSEQQLDKMRDVLQQLDTEQLIIVSHEQKIESFVDNLIRLKKTLGVSEKAE